MDENEFKKTCEELLNAATRLVSRLEVMNGQYWERMDSWEAEELRKQAATAHKAAVKIAKDME